VLDKVFIAVTLISTVTILIGSQFIIENIFELSWELDLKILIYLSSGIGLITLLLIMITNLKYLNPKVYPLIRNQ